MKKLFIAVLAVAALASCMQDEVLSQDQAAIEFGDAFVDNSTKALYGTVDGTTTNVKAFQVWGTVKGTGDAAVALYEGANVYNGTTYGVAWTCDVTRFWTPNCDYAFYAVVDSTVTPAQGEAANTNVIVADTNKGVVESIKYVADGMNDLLYGYKEENTDDAIPTLVEFNMNHLLSLVKVTFKNSVNTSDKAYSYKISDVKVTGWAEGTYDVAEESWAKVDDNTFDHTFAAVEKLAEGETVNAGLQLIIPNQPITVSFTYEEQVLGKTYLTKQISQTVVATAVKNNYYSINVDFQKNNEIKFTISDENGVAGWVSGTGSVTIQ